MKQAALTLLVACASLAPARAWAQGDLDFDTPSSGAIVLGPPIGTASTATSARGGDHSDLESEMFGSELPPSAPSPTPASDDPLDDKSSYDRLLGTLGATNDNLQLGGDLWLWLQYATLREGAPKNFRLSSPSFVDVYLDARPNERLRAYARGRLDHDFTVGSDDRDLLGRPLDQSRVRLDQLFVNFDIAHTVFVTAGRQRIRWGASRFWNPSDFLNRQRRDPLAFLDLRLGIGLLKLHLPLEALGWNFYAIADLEEASRPNDVGGALRAEMAFGTAEVSLSLAGKKDAPFHLGADVSIGVWLFDLRAELALTHGERQTFYRGTLAFDPPEGIDRGELWNVRLPLPEAYDRRDDWIPQLVLGAELTVPFLANDQLVFGAEYFYNNAGYSSADLYPWLILNNAYVPLYTGRHYAAAYAVAYGPGDWDDSSFVLSALGNLSDRSFLARFDYSIRVLTYLDLRAFAAYAFGEPGELRFELSVPPLAGPDGMAIPGLESGLRVAPPLITLGAAMSLRL